MREKKKLINLLSPSSSGSERPQFLEYHSALVEYRRGIEAVFRLPGRRRHPMIPVTLVEKAALAGVTLDRFCSALPQDRTTVVAAVKKFGARLDGVPRPSPESKPLPGPLPEPETSYIFNHLTSETDMQKDAANAKKLRKKAYRGKAQIEQMILTAIDELSAAGDKVNRNKVASLTGLAHATVARRWASVDTSESANSGQDTIPAFQLPSFDDDDEAGFAIVAQTTYGSALEPGSYQVAPHVYKCDALINTDGNLVPHVEAWRRRLPEVRDVIKLFRELRA